MLRAADRHTCWLTTLGQDGSPHVTAVGALRADDAFWFETGRGRGRAEFSAPSAGPPPWAVHRITARSATALATTGSGGATRWRF